jgi:hypothetical protein
MKVTGKLIYLQFTVAEAALPAVDVGPAAAPAQRGRRRYLASMPGIALPRVAAPNMDAAAAEVAVLDDGAEMPVPAAVDNELDSGGEAAANASPHLLDHNYSLLFMR